MMEGGPSTRGHACGWLPVALAALVAFAALSRPTAQPASQRIVSLVPAATEMLFAIGAGPRVVGVSSFDKHPAEVASRTRVGALVDPDIERIFALRPELVVVYATQDELRTQLARAGIRAFTFRHGGLADVPRTMRDLGTSTGRVEDAERAAREFEGAVDRVREAVKGRTTPKTLLVFGRDPGTLRNIYASGGLGFLHDALVAAGGANVFGEVARESVQASTEMILARSPEVIVELRSTGLLDETARAREADAWSRLASLPAVRGRRVAVLNGEDLVVPGPRLARGVLQLARVLHPAVVGH